MSLHYSIYTVGGTHIVEAFEYDSGYTSVGRFKFTPKDLLGEAGTGSTISLKNLVTEGYVFQNVALSNLWKENNQQTNWSDLTELNSFLEATVHAGTTINEINDIGDVNITKPAENTDIKLSVLVYDASTDKIVLGPAYTLPGSGAPPPEGFSSFFTDQDLGTISGIEFKENSNTLKINTTSSITQSAKLMVGGNIVTTGKIFFKNVFSDVSSLPTASSYSGMLATVTSTGAAYFSHNSAWVRLANQSEVFDGDYNSLSNLPTLFDGSYTSLSNIPSTFTPSAHNQAWSTITNTPTTLSGYGITDAFDGSYTSLSNIPTSFTPSAHTHTASNITDFDTEVSNNSSVVANTAKVSFPGFGTTAGTALEGDTALFDGQYSSLSGVPSTFTPSSHTHTASEITDFDAEVSNNTDVVANTAKVSYPSADSTKVAFISVTQAVNLDTMESDIATNNAKVSYTDAAVDARIGAASISDLSDVPTIGTAGQVLVVNAGATALEYANQTGGGASAIDDLTDVDTSTTTPSPNDTLVWDGTNWVPGTVSGTGSPWTTSGSDIYYTTGNVGIGTATPGEALDVSGKANINDGSNNVLISTGNSTITASNTVAVGYQALTALTTGTDNTAVGYQAGAALTTGSTNIHIGYEAGKASTADNNVYIGKGAGSQAVGSSRNVVIGNNAFLGANDQVANVIIGNDAVKNSPSHALYSNVIIGDKSGEDLSSVSHSNVIVGYQCVVHQGGISEAAILGSTVSYPSVGDRVSIVGARAQGGDNTCAIGRTAGNYLSQNSVFIGYNAGSNETSSNKLYIENSNSATPLIYGEFDNDILRVNGTLQVNDPASTGYAFPTATGTLGQVLEVDANGDLIFATPSGGGGGTPLASADQTLTGDRLIDTNGYNLAIELDPTGTADTFTVHDGTHDLFQVDTSTSGTLFSVNDVSGLPKLEVDDTEGVIAKSIKVDDGALTTAGQYGKGAEIWYQGTSTPTAGSVYYLNSSGDWSNTDASAVATAKGMLSVSVGTDSDVDGMVIKGFVYVGTDPGGSVGDVVYLSETANQLTTTAPTTASAVVRVCGYKVGTNIVYFDPSKDWIELS